MSVTGDGRSRRVAIVIRQALLMIVAAIEKEYGLPKKGGHKLRVEILPDDGEGNYDFNDTG